MNEWRWGAVLSAILVGVGGFYWYVHNYGKTPAPVEATAAPAPELPPPPPAVPAEPDYPVPPVAVAAPLAELDASDAPFRAALLQLSAKLDEWLVPELLIRKIVATVDNLGRDRAAINLRPVKRAPGEFRVNVAGAERWTIAADNEARYAPAVAVFAALDANALVALYFRWYPRFQKAYADLGFPGRSFNNRVVAVIDSLLATPEPAGALLLAKPKVYFEYASVDLESLPAGQKLLLRIGAAQRATVKAQLRAIRAAIVAGQAEAH